MKDVDLINKLLLQITDEQLVEAFYSLHPEKPRPVNAVEIMHDSREEVHKILDIKPIEDI